MFFSKLAQSTAARCAVRTQVRRAGDKAFVSTVLTACLKEIDVFS